MTNVDLAVVMLYPDWWKDRSVLGLQEEVKLSSIGSTDRIKKKWAPSFV